jgi:hypothetical protein
MVYRLNMVIRTWVALALSIGLLRPALAGVQPTEFLDERTGATITVVHDPLIVPLRRSVITAMGSDDVISLTAVEVDRSGDLQLFLVGYDWSGSNRLAKPLQLQADDKRVELVPMEPFPAELLNDRKLLAPPYSHLQRAGYRVTRELLAVLAACKHLNLMVMEAGSEQPYDVWEGRPSFKAFVERINAFQSQ